MRKDEKHTRNAKGLLTALAAFTLALGVGVAVAPKELAVTNASTEISLHKEDFNTGFTAGTTYNNTTEKVDGPIGKQWCSIMGTASSTSPIEGAMSMQMRSYAKNATIGRATTKFSLKYVTKMTFSAKANADGGTMSVEYSTDNSTWKAMTVTGTYGKTTSTLTATIPQIDWGMRPTVWLRINHTTINVANQMRIDGVEIFGIKDESAPDPTSITITAAGGATTVGIGQKLQLSATVSPSAAIQTVTWSSNSNATATVDASGLVTGVKTGPVVITATSTEKPSITKTISLTVFDPFAGYDGFETFEEHTLTGNTYSSGSYDGDHVTITYADARADQGFQISGKGIMFRGTDSYIEFTLESGISELSFEWMKAHTAAGDRQLGIYINGIKVDETEAKDEADVVQVYSKTFATPYSGTTIVKIAGLLGSSSSARQLTLDNVKWKDGPEVTFGVLSSLVINTDNVKKEYYNGDLLSLGGLIATAYDTEGRYKIVTAEVTSSPLEGYEFILADALAGTKSINITFSEGGKQASQSFSVTVIELVLPTNIIFDVSAVYTSTGDSGTSLVAGSLETKDDILLGNQVGDVLDVSIQIDEKDEVPRVYYAGADHAVAGIQPLKLGSNNFKGNIKLYFVEEITVITKVTIYARRISANATNATLQVNDAPAQNIGVSGKADVKFGAYEFEGPFGNELVIRNNTNLAVYVFGIDIEFMTYDEEALAFANEVMSGVGLGAEGNCHAVLEELEEMYDGLSSWAQEEFENNTAQIFVNARARLAYLRAWTAVNTKPKPHSPQVQNQINPTVAALVIGAIGVATLGGCFFLNKRKVKLLK